MTNPNFRFLLQDDLIPAGFLYPEDYLAFTKRNEFPNLKPWRFLWLDEPEFMFNGLKSRYTSRCLVPFGRRQGSDEIACFDGADTSGNPPIFIVHDFASPGWEQRGTLKSFSDWLQMATDDAKEWRAEQEDDE